MGNHGLHRPKFREKLGKLFFYSGNFSARQSEFLSKLYGIYGLMNSKIDEINIPSLTGMLVRSSTCLK